MNKLIPTHLIQHPPRITHHRRKHSIHLFQRTKHIVLERQVAVFQSQYGFGHIEAPVFDVAVHVAEHEGGWSRLVTFVLGGAGQRELAHAGVVQHEALALLGDFDDTRQQTVLAVDEASGVVDNGVAVVGGVSGFEDGVVNALGVRLGRGSHIVGRIEVVLEGAVATVWSDGVEQELVQHQLALHRQTVGLRVFGFDGVRDFEFVGRDGVRLRSHGAGQLALHRPAHQLLGTLHHRRLEHQQVVASAPHRPTLHGVGLHERGGYLLLGDERACLDVCVLFGKGEPVLLV